MPLLRPRVAAFRRRACFCRRRDVGDRVANATNIAVEIVGKPPVGVAFPSEDAQSAADVLAGCRWRRIAWR
jgi:hypothetical protein